MNNGGEKRMTSIDLSSGIGPSRVLRSGDGQRGLAAMELALALPMLLVLLLLLVEGAGAMHAYSILSDASREGARLVLRAGETSGVVALVDSVAEQLPGDDPQTTVVMEGGGQTVTVEVSYAYQSFLGAGSGLFGLLWDAAPVLHASTTMPLP
ncbi:MAG: TadE family type IV pilus minor pilin [Desulfovibrio sp.]